VHIPIRPLLFLILVASLLVSSGLAFPPPVAVDAAMPAHDEDKPPAPPSFGVNAHLATRYPDPSSMHIPGGVLDDLGVEWVREDFHWYRVQPQRDVWDWHFNDAAVRELVQRDINILGVIGGPSAPWATPFRGDSTEYASFYAPDTDAFVAFARGVVKRYHRYIHHWEIWNEPDNINFWKPQPDPAAYANLLIRTSAAIKEIDPDATVLIGGFNPFDTTFFRTVLDAGAWDSFDVIAIHPYVDPLAPEEGNIAAAADLVRVLAGRHGSKPLWVTEVGWASGPGDNDPLGTTSEEHQASYLVRTMLLLWQAGIERTFWYTLKDDEGNPYGLIALGDGRLDYRRRKPAFEAFRMLNRQLTHAQFVERRDLFETTTLLDFETMDNWHRPFQPNGTLQASGVGTARLTYNFTTDGNDYVAFECLEGLHIPTTTLHALGMWVYGDGSGHELKVWVRDAEGEVLQFRLGFVDVPGWQFMSVPVHKIFYDGNRISGSGNGWVDTPARFQAIVLDDLYDGYQGTGTLYLDNLSVVSGREVYDLRFERGNDALDILWSPPGTRISLATRSTSGKLITLTGNGYTVEPDERGRFSLTISDEPVYLWHRR
jgi:hypothetical protein